MPLIGELTSDGSRVDITLSDDPRRDYPRGSVKCRFCPSKFITKAGRIKRPHFAHEAKCTTDLESHPESDEHMMGKSKVRDWLCETKGASLDDVLIEHQFPEAGRIADVAWIRDDVIDVYEVQFASITTEQLEARTEAYNKIGVTVYWLLGGKAHTPATTDWIASRYTELLTMTFKFERGAPETMHRSLFSFEE